MPKNSVPENETPAERFVRLARQRGPKAIKQIHLIRNLATGNYEYTDEQAEYIVSQLQAAVDDLRDKFKGTKQAEIEFNL